MSGLRSLSLVCFKILTDLGNGGDTFFPVSVPHQERLNGPKVHVDLILTEMIPDS